jgi:hypothetical protein
MRAPRKTNYFWDPPDRGWLEHHYVELNKSAQQIAREIGSSGKTVAKWLKKVGLEVRKVRRGEGLCGTSRIARRTMRALGMPKRCTWCGTQEERIEVHHKDHDPYNNHPNNLMYLCPTCHRVETALWYLHNREKAVVKCEGHTITIKFREVEHAKEAKR